MDECSSFFAASPWKRSFFSPPPGETDQIPSLKPSLNTIIASDQSIPNVPLPRGQRSMGLPPSTDTFFSMFSLWNATHRPSGEKVMSRPSTLPSICIGSNPVVFRRKRATSDPLPVRPRYTTVDSSGEMANESPCPRWIALPDGVPIWKCEIDRVSRGSLSKLQPNAPATRPATTATAGQR